MCLMIYFWVAFCLAGNVGAFSATPKTAAPKRHTKPKSQSSSLVFSLQKCTTPAQVLQDVGSQMQPSSDPQGTVSSLTLIRLSKQLTTLQNEYLHPTSSVTDGNGDVGLGWSDHAEKNILCLESQQEGSISTIKRVVQTLSQATTASRSTDWDAIVEGTKAAAVLSRIIPEIVTLEACEPLLKCWEKVHVRLQPHQLSGLHWAYACFEHVYNQELPLPINLQQEYERCNLPFCILPGYLANVPGLTVGNLVDEVPFQVDTIRTTSTRQVVQERRETAWLGDEGVEPFRYSGKSMPRFSWSPLVETIRDALAQSKYHPCYYDGCLLNHYPDGGSAMRYHSDPDQGRLWGFTTTVVSVGASRRVAFRSTPNNKDFSGGNATGSGKKKKKKKETNTQKSEQPHNFVVMHGDVMVMIDDCQRRFQHAVKPADNKQEHAARASLVFKQTLPDMRQ